MISPRSSFYLLGLSIFLGCASSASAQKSDLVPAGVRAEVVAKANELATRDIESLARLPDDPTNPFTGKLPKVSAQTAAPVAVRSLLSDDQKLNAIAGSIQPTGTIALGGESYLLFGQKKFKVGDSIPIVFEGVTYDVVFTDIQSTRFSIRLGDADLVRPIKTTRP